MRQFPALKINENESTFAPLRFDKRKSKKAWNQDFPQSKKVKVPKNENSNLVRYEIIET